MPNTTRYLASAANSQQHSQQPRLLSLSTAISTKCSAQSVAYGKCVVANYEKLNKDTCQKEFVAFRDCMKTALKTTKK